MSKNKKILSIDELAANAEKLLKGKKLNPNGKTVFERTLKKSVRPHGPKRPQT